MIGSLWQLIEDARIAHRPSRKWEDLLVGREYDLQESRKFYLLPSSNLLSEIGVKSPEALYFDLGIVSRIKIYFQTTSV